MKLQRCRRIASWMDDECRSSADSGVLSRQQIENSFSVTLLGLLDLSAASVLSTMPSYLIGSLYLSASVVSSSRGLSPSLPAGLWRFTLTFHCLDMLCGVPQGNVIGQALFLRYTADVLKIVLHHGLSGHSYADVHPGQQVSSSCCTVVLG